MTDPESSNGRPRLPLWIAVVSVVVAVASVSVLVLVLYEETKGPAEILREFARRVDRDDCQGSYDLLSEDFRGYFSEEGWCSEIVPSVDAALDADFDLERSVLEGNVARLEVSGVGQQEWLLVRHGGRSWRIDGTPIGGGGPLDPLELGVEFEL